MSVFKMKPTLNGEGGGSGTTLYQHALYIQGAVTVSSTRYALNACLIILDTNETEFDLATLSNYIAQKKASYCSLNCNGSVYADGTYYPLERMEFMDLGEESLLMGIYVYIQGGDIELGLNPQTGEDPQDGEYYIVSDNVIQIF